MNNSWPNTDPWGTPQGIGLTSDLLSFENKIIKEYAAGLGSLV